MTDGEHSGTASALAISVMTPEEEEAFRFLEERSTRPRSGSHDVPPPYPFATTNRKTVRGGEF